MRRKAAAVPRGSQVKGRDMRELLLEVAQAVGTKERLGIDQKREALCEKSICLYRRLVDLN